MRAWWAGRTVRRRGGVMAGGGPIGRRWLVAALLTLTAVTGLIDAVSYLRLGHVFVANMTGNVVFLGFALSDAREFSVPASLLAIAAFLGGAVVGGRMGSRSDHHRARL